MGGVMIATNASDASIFGNPAGLIDVEGNNLSAGVTFSDFRHVPLSAVPEFQFSEQLELGLSPSITYSRSVQGAGFSIGYLSSLRNKTTFSLENTRSEYLVDEQRFLAKTLSITEYEQLLQSGWYIGYSKKMGRSQFGLRLNQITQHAKRGRVLVGLALDAQHASDINVNDPRALIPAIIDSLDLANLGQYIDQSDEVSQDLEISNFDFDLGYQHYFNIDMIEKRRVLTGLVIRNLLQRKLVAQLPTTIGIGANTKIFQWLTTGLDLWRVPGHRGLDVAFGWELAESWQRGFSGNIALRNGWSRIDGVGIFSFGLSLGLGGSRWEYSMQARFRNQPLAEATHSFASTVRF